MHAVERTIARIGSRQDNVITLAQLLAAGLGRGAVVHRVSARVMQRMHRGVHLLGAAPPTPMAQPWRARRHPGSPHPLVRTRGAHLGLWLLPASLP